MQRHDKEKQRENKRLTTDPSSDENTSQKLTFSSVFGLHSVDSVKRSDERSAEKRPNNEEIQPGSAW